MVGVMSDQPCRPALRLVKGSASETAAAFTVKDVADACGLPQPVVAQLVPRTWTAEGWMYTGEQVEAAVSIAEEFRARSADGNGGEGPSGPQCW